ncbi:MAG: LysE family translocator, partial [Mesorhizobium sp.]
MAGGVLGDPQSWQQVLALVLAATVVMGSPGPATISVTAVGAAFGLSPSLSYTAGVVLGTMAVLLAVAAGILGLLTSVPGVAPVLAILSAAYILYL